MENSFDKSSYTTAHHQLQMFRLFQELFCNTMWPFILLVHTFPQAAKTAQVLHYFPFREKL